ncbi:hypothetical protein RR46_10524 [Papilio xuthus]|uniref:SEA domain-containing protein n=1 Tax=Papilio xuthus TaxID=66420 RepID=A0A194PKK5_PAPXU|nr:hypothetical protein RR46_10524 [Papilio xuthus]
MGRRRWRIVTIAAFLLFIIKDTQCQDENDYYYTPVERSFAQVQPSLFPNTRPSSFFDNGDSFKVSPAAHQSLFNNGRLPSPGYNQNPSPFQLPSGRSQSGAQYYINQPEISNSQRQRFRPSLPFNYQIVHPASTKKPDLQQIHSVAYQNDPTKQETFLGQITINNPDIDFLQNNRFKTLPFDSNSLRSNGQSGHIPREEDIENDNTDLFDQHRVTTYNPNSFIPKNKLNVNPNNSRFSHFNTPVTPSKASIADIEINKYLVRNQSKGIKNIPQHDASSTEYKSLLDIEPLLEDDISDITSFRELLKNNQKSHDVQVITAKNESDVDDSKADASFMSPDNTVKDISKAPLLDKNVNTTSVSATTPTSLSADLNNGDDSEELDGKEEYYEYYEESENTEIKPTTTTKAIEPVTDIYDEYDATEADSDKYNEDEQEKVVDEVTTNVTNTFDVLVMKANNTMVKDDNFKEFVDTTVIDQSDPETSNSTAPNVKVYSSEEISSIETPSILGQEVVSVVTTKSVVNGTISIPDATVTPSSARSSEMTPLDSNDDLPPVTTENWIVVASVQTSRSVSGARFLPFPTVEQEEKKQVLTDEKDDEEGITSTNAQEQIGIVNSSSSTENINDKLDSIQSELSSSVLSGNLNSDNKNIELITESTTEQINTTVRSTMSPTTPTLPNVFTLKSTQVSSITERSSPDPLPVMIKKFTPRMTSSTTPKPRKKPSLVTIVDEIAGFLPPGYKPKLSFKDKRTSTTTTTTTRTTTTTTSTALPITLPPLKIPIINGTQGRSSGINTKNKVIILDDKSLLPKEYRPKENKPQEDLLNKLKKDDISKFLPPGYKPSVAEETQSKQPEILEKVQKVDISAFLPKGFTLNNTSTASTTEMSKPSVKIPANAVPVDLSALLPPNYKLIKTESVKSEDLLSKIKIADISNLLPPGFKPNITEESTEPSTSSTSTKPTGGIKLVFPSRPGGKSVRKTTPKSTLEMGPSPVTPKIQKGWPTRASTEFTGWPSPSTTPFSIEKLLEAQRNATATTPFSINTEATTTRRTTTTTTTTVAPPPPTTPGVCRHECDIAATIKIVAGAKWVPELLDHHTEEWQKLAKEVKEELNSVYGKSDLLRKWYKDIRIDGFTPGSILVDYFIELNDVEDRVDTLQLKRLFHKTLNHAKPGSVVEEQIIDEDFDPDVMLGDQPEEDKMRKSNEKMTKTIDKSVGKLEMGKFVMDPAYTEFIVLPKREDPTIVEPGDEAFLPQWGIAVIVIAMASLLFVVIFGVTVLVNRQKSAKAKQPIPLSEDMLRELDKSHMGGFEDTHQMKERDLPSYPPSGKRMSTAFIEQLAYQNPGDSWRSEWTPQLHKYMQHYTPDSGRGSQTYGVSGNGYGYGGSQLYGQNGAGSQVYGYTGEYPRSHYSRRRSDYDNNF